jgi:sigma-B regulation protein RsbU (phosphoserine phosphatase)
MVFCILDTHIGRLQYTCAGHPLPIVLRNGRLVPLEDAGGFPLAVVGDATYDEASVDLKPGDRVHLYSDGILEEFDAQEGEQFGTERLEQLLIRLVDQPPERAVVQVVESLTAWGGRKSFKDDVSLVILDWVGPQA